MSKKGINKFRALNSIYSINENESGITLIALVVTFIVFLVNIRNVDFAIGCEYL